MCFNPHEKSGMPRRKQFKVKYKQARVSGVAANPTNNIFRTLGTKECKTSTKKKIPPVSIERKKNGRSCVDVRLFVRQTSDICESNTARALCL